MGAAAEDEIRVYFGVFEFGRDPQVVTQLMGCEPSVAWSKGESYGEHGGIRTHSRWELRSPARSSASVEAQLNLLLDLLERCAVGVRGAAARFSVGIHCVAYYRNTFNPELHLSAAALSRVAALGLSIDFDLYFLSESEFPSEPAG